MRVTFQPEGRVCHFVRGIFYCRQRGVMSKMRTWTNQSLLWAYVDRDEDVFAGDVEAPAFVDSM